MEKEKCEKCKDGECTCNTVADKPLEEKNIVERHTMSDGKFNLGNALVEQEHIIKHLLDRIVGLEEAMQFFSEWYNRTQRVDILVPDTLAQDKPKIIL